MGVGAIEVVTTNDRQPSTNFQLAEDGILTSMVVVVPDADVVLGMVYAESGIMSGGVGKPFISAVLISSYVTQRRPAHWFGSLRLALGDVVYITGLTADGNIMRLTWRRDDSE